jgi:hypothetical protein
VGLPESLNDFAACVAVAVGTDPDAYPAWSDGFKAHFAEILLLWAEIRPQLRRDADQVDRIEVVMQKMAAAVEVGDLVNFREAARTLLAMDVSRLR